MRGFGVMLAILLVGLSVDAIAGDSFRISSPAFSNGKPMPARFAKKGGNLSPELHIAGVPSNAVSLVLIVDDPDAPSGLWTHWLLANIPPDTKVIAEGKVPAGAIQGKNSFGNARYDGPLPPSGTHRYFFHLYALDRKLDVATGFGRMALKSVDHPVSGKDSNACEMYGTYSANP
jgi:Raf kinase inhibitor-like YbhB/YbcL family protein